MQIWLGLAQVFILVEFPCFGSRCRVLLQRYGTPGYIHTPDYPGTGVGEGKMGKNDAGRESSGPANQPEEQRSQPGSHTSPWL